ncbi:MAG: nitroreductase [Burkholderiaceae bacterium]
MHVDEAVATRRSIRDFLPDPVPEAVIRRVLEKALRAPSGGNVQPWHLHVLAGAPLAQFKALMRERLETSPAGDGDPEYDIYPSNLHSPYRERRYELGEQMYAQMGIGRDQKPRRLAWVARNYQFFDAPMALFCSIDRRMGPPQWSDLGMLLQTIMLLLRAEGLDSCPQEAWSRFHRTVGEFIGLPGEQMLFCGMAIGKANPEHPVNSLVAERAPLGEVVTFMTDESNQGRP